MKKNKASLSYISAISTRIAEPAMRLVSSIQKKYQWRVENKEYLTKSRIAIRVSAAGLLLVMVGILAFPQASSASIYVWTQTNWDGGVGASTSTQYSSATNLDTSTTGEFSLTNLEKVTNTSFDSNLDDWTTDNTEIAPGVVQTVSLINLSAAIFNITFGQTPQENNTMVLAFTTRTNPGTISFPGWTQDATVTNTSTNARTIIFRKVAGASESTTVTIDPQNTVVGTMTLYELSGVDTVNPLDQTSSIQSAAVAGNVVNLPTTGTTTQSNEIAIAAVGFGAGTSAFTSWSNGFMNALATAAGGYSSVHELDSKQTVATTLTVVTARTYAGLLVTYKGARASQVNTAGPGVRQSTSAAFTASLTPTATFPVVPLAGNTVFAAFTTAAAPGTVTPAAGWTEHFAPQSPTGSTTHLYSKIVAAGDPAAVSFTTTNPVTGRMDIYETRGLVSNPLDQSATIANVNTNPIVITGGTTTTNIQLALGAAGINTTSGLPTSWASSGFTLGTGTSIAQYQQSAFKYLRTTQVLTASIPKPLSRVTQGFLASFKSGGSYVSAARDTGTQYAGSASAKIESNPWALSRFTQSIDVGDTNSYEISTYVYTDGAAVTSADAQLFYNGDVISTTYDDAGSGWYRLSAIISGINSSVDFGLEIPKGKTVFVDDFSVNRFEDTGTLTSNIFDTTKLSNWGLLNYVSSGSGTVSVRARTSLNSDMSGAPNFNTCADITTGTDISTGTNGCVTDAERYIQYQVILGTGANATPTFSSISIEHSGSDVTAPDTNADAIEMFVSNGGDQIPSNGWTKSSLPTFTWTAGIDNPGGVGIAGYCAYLGTDSNADPLTTKGLLGTGPLDTESTCPFAIAGETLDLTTAGLLGTALTSSNAPYYLHLKTIDANFNIFTGASESFQFRFDNTAPTNPAFITSPSGFIATKTANLTWPTASGDAPADSNSGVAGLQYRIGASGTWYGDDHTGAQDFTDLLVNDGSYTTINIPDFDNLIEGINVIYFRTYDQAGNTSTGTITTSLKINTAGAPSAPQNITATPPTNTANSFAFSWTAPNTFVGAESNLTYCYTVNATPTANNCTFTAPGQLSIPAGPYATQPGSNTFFVVARDESMSINYATADSVTFSANTSAPGIAVNTDISDTSVRATENWRLVITWEPPSDVGAGVAKYDVQRSTDGTNYAPAGNTSGSSYVDTGLESQQYYYKIRACDSANNCGAFTAPIDKTPTGRYTTAPLMTSEGGVPRVEDIQTRAAKISWTTDRNSDSKVAFGTISGSYGSTESYSSRQTVNHEIQLENLVPGTTYYYVVRWTDTDGNTGASTELAFETLPPPTVQDVSATAVALTSATLQYTTTGASGVKIYYGKTSGFGSVLDAATSGDTSTYLALLRDLSDGTKYFYKINALDANGFEYDGTTISFETPPAPHISNVRFQPVANEPSSTQLVSWDTNVAASSELSYGVVGGETLTSLDNTMTTAHQVTISQLVDDSLYSLIARSRDGNGNVAISDAQTFRTELDTRPPTITEVTVVPSIRGTGTDARGQIIVSWKTDEPSTSQVVYGEGTTGDLNNSSAQSDRLSLDHAIVISDLSTSKVYSIRPISFDKGDNEAKGDVQTAIIGRGTQSALAIIFSVLQKIFGVAS